MKKVYLALLIVLFAISFVVLIRLHPKYYGEKLPSSLENTTVGEIGGSGNSNGGTANGISMEILSSHNSESDCWIAYDGKVYDITFFIPNHPGGKNRIIPYCGTADEFQNAFRKEHGTSKIKMLMSVGVLMGDFEVIGSVNG